MLFNRKFRIKKKAIFPGYDGLIVPVKNGYESEGSFTGDENYDKVLMDWLRKHYKEQGKHVVDVGCDFDVGCVCILTELGKPYLFRINQICWIGLKKKFNEALLVGIPNGEKVVDFSFIKQGIRFITSVGNVYGCGYNEFGNLGIGNWKQQSRNPVLMQMPDNEKVIKLSRGKCNLVITKENQVYGCGYNGDKRLGPKNEYYICLPTLLKKKHFDNEKVIDIHSGAKHSIFLTEKDNVFACGSNAFGQLGHGNVKGMSFPTKITSLKNVKSICAGNYTSFFITKENGKNKVYMCGENDCDVVIKSAADRIRTTTEIEFFRGKKIVQIDKGGLNVYFISKHGEIYVSGPLLKNESEKVKGIRLLNVKCMKERLRNQSSEFFLEGRKERRTYLIENMPVPSSLFITGDPLNLNEESEVKTQKPEPCALKK